MNFFVSIFYITLRQQLEDYKNLEKSFGNILPRSVALKNKSETNKSIIEKTEIGTCRKDRRIIWNI